MPESRSKPAPKGLQKAGRRLWREITSAYVLRPDELTLLESACRTLDTINALDAEMAGQPLITTGSMGQKRENPLLSEARQQRAQLGRTLAQLKLPDDATTDGAAATNRHRTAAQSRWTKHATEMGWRYGQ